MRKVKIILPATVTNLGPALSGLGLALGLHATVEVSAHTDSNLVVESKGEGADRYLEGFRHPVLMGMVRVFQRLERAPHGLNIRVDNEIPLSGNLGAELALLLAGIIGANNLLDNPFTRQELLELAATISGRPSAVAAAILGGMAAATVRDNQLTYRTLPLTQLRVIVVVPEIEDYTERIRDYVNPRITLEDASYNLSHIPLLLAALQEGDVSLLDKAMEDRLLNPYLSAQVVGYDHVVEMARRNGAQAVTLSGNGPALMAFAQKDHDNIATIMQNAFENVGVPARSWVLPLDTQGVVISVVG